MDPQEITKRQNILEKKINELRKKIDILKIKKPGLLNKLNELINDIDNFLNTSFIPEYKCYYVEHNILKCEEKLKKYEEEGDVNNILYTLYLLFYYIYTLIHNNFNNLFIKPIQTNLKDKTMALPNIIIPFIIFVNRLYNSYTTFVKNKSSNKVYTESSIQNYNLQNLLLIDYIKNICFGNNFLNLDQTKLDTIKKELSSDQTKIDTIKKELSSDQTKLDTIKKELSSDQTKLDTIKKELSSDQTKLDTIKKELSSDQTKLETIKKELSSDQTKLDTIKKELNSDQTKLDTIKKELRSDQTKLETIKKKLSSNQTKLETLENKNYKSLKQKYSKTAILLEKERVSNNALTELNRDLFNKNQLLQLRIKNINALLSNINLDYLYKIEDLYCNAVDDMSKIKIADDDVMSKSIVTKHQSILVSGSLITKQIVRNNFNIIIENAKDKEIEKGIDIHSLHKLDNLKKNIQC